jgi:hypothetical protein
MSWRTRLSDPWYVLPISVLAGAVLALSLAIALEPDNDLEPNLATAVATATPHDPTPDAATALRETRRRIDLLEVKAALDAYHEDHGAYPFTTPGIQPLCVDEEMDAGCLLRPYLDPLPVDPLGAPAVNGYWYESDGESHVLYARMETSEGIDPSTCPSPLAPRFADAVAMLCIPGGAPSP